MARRACGGEIGALLGLLEEVWVGRPRGRGVHHDPAATKHPWCLERQEGQTQQKLERVVERAVAEREGVVDGQGGEPDGGGSRGGRSTDLQARKQELRILVESCKLAELFEHLFN